MAVKKTTKKKAVKKPAKKKDAKAPKKAEEEVPNVRGTENALLQAMAMAANGLYKLTGVKKINLTYKFFGDGTYETSFNFSWAKQKKPKAKKEG